jgi:mannitol/fructose-specific phosphotransferase system IIA component
MQNDWMTVNIQLERIENEASTIQSKVLCCHLPTGTEESHEKSVRIVCVLVKTKNKHLQNTRSVTVSGNMLGMFTCRIDIY